MQRPAARAFANLAAILAVMLLALLAGRGGAGSNRQMLAESVAITAYPIAHFRHGQPEERRFGQLEFIGGLELSGAHVNFGGLSAIRVGPDGESLLALTDTGDWLRARIVSRGGAPIGLADVTVAPMLGRDGRRLKDSGLWDSESLAIVGDEVFVGFERAHAVLRFDLSRDGLRGRGVDVPLPPFIGQWPENRGIEALGVAPEGTPLAGRLIGISERSGYRDDPTEGFVMDRDGGQPFRFRLARSDGFDITDLDFLPGGDLIVLERYFSPLRGVAMRLRRIATAGIQPDALVDGEVVMTADSAFQVDNMEGLSIHRGADGGLVFTIISDDNFSVAQRTLLLRFRWLGD